MLDLTMPTMRSGGRAGKGAARAGKGAARAGKGAARAGKGAARAGNGASRPGGKMDAGESGTRTRQAGTMVSP